MCGITMCLYQGLIEWILEKMKFVTKKPRAMQRVMIVYILKLQSEVYVIYAYKDKPGAVVFSKMQHLQPIR